MNAIKYYYIIIIKKLQKGKGKEKETWPDTDGPGKLSQWYLYSPPLSPSSELHSPVLHNTSSLKQDLEYKLNLSACDGAEPHKSGAVKNTFEIQLTIFLLMMKQ